MASSKIKGVTIEIGGNTTKLGKALEGVNKQSKDLQSKLKGLGCTISDDYEYHSGHSCSNSSYNSWLANGQWWWTRSAYSSHSYFVWFVNSDGILDYDIYSSDGVVCPVITISKDLL